MRKFSINREKKEIEPSSDQLKRNKDFSRLRHDYELITKRSKKPIYKNPKLYLLGFLILIVLLLILFDN